MISILYRQSKEGNGITTQTIESIGSPLDRATFLPMINVINQLPDDAELKTRSHPEIHQTLNTRDMLYGVKHPLGTVVALAGAMIEQGGRVIRITEIAASGRAEHDATEEMMDEFVTHAREHGADELLLDLTPQPGTAAGEFAERYHFSPDEHGAYILKLSEVELDQSRG